MIAEAIFNSLIRYGAAVYLNPTYEKEDLKFKRFPKKILLLDKLYRII